MGVLPCGIIIAHLADLALLDWAGSTIWMKTFKMKGGSQHTGDVKRVCVCGGVYKRKSPDLSNQVD